ncbi:hypothetical protein DYB30_005174 [Aphanomyces astaci]|uniref:DDE-1 domain-containing protein n=1 Tax=Aphanomyces astaci TaxID=112090 RepID=A0A397D6U0_APHAT|nr:hypothetical protein DYB30_005174 [Aphanomyces astaci]
MNSTLRPTKRSYPVSFKLHALQLLRMKLKGHHSTAPSVRGTWCTKPHHSFVENQKDDILDYRGNKKRMKISPGGRCEIFPDPNGLFEYISEMRVCEGTLTTTHIINTHQLEWLRLYLAEPFQEDGKGFQWLHRLLQRFCHRHGFSRQKFGHSNQSKAALMTVRDEFAEDFHHSYRAFDDEAIYNVDETGFYYDMPPRYIWVAVQLKAWMDNEVWTTYLRSLLLPQLSEPSILLLGNFESHVSEESYSIVTD